jgi:hypothetical protein
MYVRFQQSLFQFDKEIVTTDLKNIEKPHTQKETLGGRKQRIKIYSIRTGFK